MLALGDALARALADRAHHVWKAAADLALFVDQAGNVVTHEVHARRGGVYGQLADKPARNGVNSDKCDGFLYLVYDYGCVKW